MYRASFRRISSAVSLRKSIESAIQWFQIHHGITFVTIHNPTVYFSCASVNISPTLVPRLTVLNKTICHFCIIKVFPKTGFFFSK